VIILDSIHPISALTTRLVGSTLTQGEKIGQETLMAVELNHTIVMARDKKSSAAFLSDILGLPAPTSWGPFEGVPLANSVVLDYLDVDGDIAPQHYAFLVSEAEFDQVFARLRARDLPYYADPRHEQPAEINHLDGGRGLYFDDPNGHNLEILTRPYGSGS
jgi:catechol 2,3-dioxygenase-like lactoylglutathione lyase family enzyme